MKPERDVLDRMKELAALDVRAEVLARLLVEEGRLPEAIAISPVGWHDRAFQPDVVATGLELGHPALFIMEVRRNGLYDILPESLFHESFRGLASTSDTPERSATVALPRALENFGNERARARRWLGPLDAALLGERVWYELESKRHVDTSPPNGMWKELASRVQSESFPAECLRFRNLIPHIHNLLGYQDRAQTVLSSVFIEPVRLRESWRPAWLAPAPQEPETSTLDTRSLDDDLILDRGGWFTLRHIRISFGPLGPDRFCTFLEERDELQKVLQEMFAFLLPHPFVFHTGDLEIIPDSGLLPFVLDGEEWQGRADYTTLLS